jgi:AcrR family transcriptional regulator
MTTRVDTRTRIKVAARKLFAERGVEAVTVREIVAAAGARNGGSLNYYFGSKEGLISELISDLFKAWSQGWLQGFADLEKAGGAPGVREVITVLVMGADAFPGVDPNPTAARFIASVLHTRRAMVREIMDQLNYTIFNHLLKYIARLRPDIPRDVMNQRLIYLSWYLISVQSAHEASLAGRVRSEVWMNYDPKANIIDTATGLVEAPIGPARAAGEARRAGSKRKQATLPRAA